MAARRRRTGRPRAVRSAAASARQMFNMELAARLARAALESGGGVRAGLALGEAEFYSGRPEEAERVLSGLVPVCADDEEAARVASARSYTWRSSWVTKRERKWW